MVLICNNTVSRLKGITTCWLIKIFIIKYCITARWKRSKWEKGNKNKNKSQIKKINIYYNVMHCLVGRSMKRKGMYQNSFEKIFIWKQNWNK